MLKHYVWKVSDKIFNRKLLNEEPKPEIDSFITENAHHIHSNLMIDYLRVENVNYRKIT